MKTRNDLNVRRLATLLVVSALASSLFSQDLKIITQVAPELDSKLLLVVRNDVAGDLGLSRSQKEKIAAAFQDIKPRGGRPPNFPGMQGIMRDKIRALLRDLEAKAVTQLTADQTKRLGEIQAQVRGPVILIDKSLRKVLAFSKDQEGAFRKIEQKFRKASDANKWRAADEGHNPTLPYGPTVELIRSTNVEITKLFRPEQAEKFETLLGKKFEANPGLGSYAGLPFPGRK
jgi:hypothetical protein